MSAEDTLPPHGQHENRRAVSQPEIDRRRAVDEKFDEIARKFTALEGSMATQAEATVSLQTDVGELKTEMKANTAVTTEVRDILTTFRTLGTFAKWISSIGAAILGLVAAWKGFSK